MRKTTLILAILILGVPSGYLMAQGSGSSRAGQRGSSPSNRNKPSSPATRRPPTAAQFASSFWGYMSNPKAPYRKWASSGKKARQGGQSGPDGSPRQLATPHVATPHGEIGQTYLNSIVSRDLKRVPISSVFVREEYSADGQTLQYITVSYRSKGVDPQNGDWFWMMYRPDGSLVKMRTDQGDREIAGRVQHCIDCHRRAGGNDFVFLNDGPASAAPSTAPSGSGSRR